ncbi:MAG: BatD family protein [bacterium]|nr:BatD family protein [bacterium]
MRALLMLVVIALVISWPAGNVLGIQLSQSLDQSEIGYEDSANFIIQIEWEGGQAAYQLERALDPFFDRLKVKGFSSSISSQPSAKGEKTVKTFHYVLVPTSSGAARIDPITISYLAMPDSVSGELLTEPMTITVAEKIPEKVSDSSNMLWLFGAVGLIVLVGGGVAFWRKRSAVPEMPVLSAEQKLLAALEDAKFSSGSDLKKFQSALHDALHGYILERFGIDSGPLPDDGIAEALDGTSLDEEQKQRLAHWFTRARKDKFRPVDGAPGEVVRIENEIRTFFDKLK